MSNSVATVQRCCRPDIDNVRGFTEIGNVRLCFAGGISCLFEALFVFEEEGMLQVDTRELGGTASLSQLEGVIEGPRFGRVVDRRFDETLQKRSNNRDATYCSSQSERMS